MLGLRTRDFSPASNPAMREKLEFAIISESALDINIKFSESERDLKFWGQSVPTGKSGFNSL
jgi:hypothetical protein